MQNTKLMTIYTVIILLLWWLLVFMSSGVDSTFASPTQGSAFSSLPHQSVWRKENIREFAHNVFRHSFYRTQK